MNEKSTGIAIPIWGRISLRRLAVWVSLALVILAGLISLVLIQGISRQLVDITQTYAVRQQASELIITLGEAEASQRGYLLTRDPGYLDPYNAAIGSIEAQVDALLDMTADDPVQSQRVRGIIGDIEGKLVEMARAVELVSLQRDAEAQSLTETGRGARLMVEVRETLNQFIAEENQKLVDRNAEIDRMRLVLAAVLIAALCSAAILAYALLSRTQRQVSALAQRHRGLMTQNEALEAEIAERTRAIEEARAHAEHERQRVEALLQDANHRIGNSLATVSSLLALQIMRSRSEEVKGALEAARLRVHAVASAHRRLRLGADLESTAANEFLNAVVEDIINTQTMSEHVTIQCEIDDIEVGARDATTIGILVSELVTNALKHAFPDGRDGTILVTLARVDAVPTLSIADNGVGLPPEAGEGGMGSLIIQQLSGQFGGKPEYSPTAGGGLTITIPLPHLNRAMAVHTEDE
ncbi:MAG: CHASE3 domain-containing protein [Devosia sp.]|uniref:sensor histidine kinase n=1 Tax=unclassified Devosia TaxID=196773 RepID=UPI0019FA96F6|nr:MULTISPECIES: CHASE3 domain-containing protein [unclassified Devosia]MBF0677616.1 CHASE3 domain-containing protein [Devosia sp.]WEJ34326.1 CHASE3 domain-containing protein [Devosia sp. SD17-2]